MRGRRSVTSRPVAAISQSRKVRPFPQIVILDQKFTLEDHETEKYLVHPKWSLMGTGKNLAEAYTSLLAEAEDIRDFYVSSDDSELTAEAIKLKRFLEKLFV